MSALSSSGGLLLCMFLALGGHITSGSEHREALYVGDVSTNSVFKFPLHGNQEGHAFVQPGSGGLDGPRGIIFDGKRHLLVVNQNVDQSFPGEILRYGACSGEFLGALVSHTDPHPPFAPRGIVLKDNILYVADEGDGVTGRLARYDGTTGAFLGDLPVPETIIDEFNSTDFRPRSLVFGPDGLLYVSLFLSPDGFPNSGAVVRYNTHHAEFVDVFIAGTQANGNPYDLNRPEGLVFGPDGKLYITSFQKDSNDTDKILIFEGPHCATPGAFIGKIDLDEVGQPRAFAQALLFGPDGFLYVPISGNGPATGNIRKYNLHTNYFEVMQSLPAGDAAWYLTFGRTDPATLDYTDKKFGCRCERRRPSGW